LRLGHYTYGKADTWSRVAP